MLYLFGSPCSSVLNLIPGTEEVFLYLLNVHQSLVGYVEKRKQKDLLKWERGCVCLNFFPKVVQ